MSKKDKKYRSDIQVLRGIAVLAVLFFHLDISLFKGGFLGVDVFLVISGYLISKNISDQVKKEQFSFKKFFVNRVKRLFPALFLTLIGSFCLGFLLLSPSLLQRLSISIITGVFSCSNFFFLNEAGYFDTDSLHKPLLNLCDSAPY